jgi:drug/metabolite transporter (DMT)-like permease
MRLSITREQGRLLSLGLVATGAGVISLDALLVRLQTLSAPAILFWRGAFGAIGFAVVGAIVYRANTVTAFRSLSKGGVLVVFLTAIGNISFVVSLSHTTVAHTVLIAGASPILTAVLAWLLLREKMPSRTWLASLVVAVGVAGIVLASPGRTELVGDVSALVAGGSLSLVLIVQRMFHDVKQLAAMSVSSLLIAIVTVPFTGSPGLGLRNAVLAGFDAGIALPIALALITSSPRRVGASEASLLLLIETVLSPFWAWWIIKETPSWQTLLSGALILGALATHSLLQVREELQMRPRATGAS